MIVPTNGRQVWYHPSSMDDAIVRHGPDPLAATIVHVWSDRMVNLQVLDSNGNAHARTSVRLMQDGDVPDDYSYAEWMPFQKGQAKAHDAARTVAPGMA
jgi:hypothetical protein